MATAPAKAKATGTPSPTPSGTASSTATPTASPTPSVSSSPSATAKASTSDVSAKLASPTATPTGTAIGEGDRRRPSATAKASATPSATASANPGATASTTTTYGDPSAVNAATMKLFDELVCKPGPNAVHRGRQLEEHRPRVHRRPAPRGTTPRTRPSPATRPATSTCSARPWSRAPTISSVDAALDTSTGQWVVNITLNSAGASAFGTLTTSQYKKYFPDSTTNEDDAVLDQIGIMLDGDVQSAPETNGALTSGSFQITRPAAERLHPRPRRPSSRTSSSSARCR